MHNNNNNNKHKRYWHLPLCQGGTSVVVPEALTVDVEGMVKYLAAQRADWVDCLTPGQIKMLTELLDPKDFPSLPVR